MSDRASSVGDHGVQVLPALKPIGRVDDAVCGRRGRAGDPAGGGDRLDVVLMCRDESVERLPAVPFVDGQDVSVGVFDEHVMHTALVGGQLRHLLQSFAVLVQDGLQIGGFAGVLGHYDDTHVALPVPGAGYRDGAVSILGWAAEDRLDENRFIDRRPFVSPGSGVWRGRSRR
jgi:hypothetical protein